MSDHPLTLHRARPGCISHTFNHTSARTKSTSTKLSQTLSPRRSHSCLVVSPSSGIWCLGCSTRAAPVSRSSRRSNSSNLVGHSSLYLLLLLVSLPAVRLVFLRRSARGCKPRRVCGPCTVPPSWAPSRAEHRIRRPLLPPHPLRPHNARLPRVWLRASNVLSPRARRLVSSAQLPRKLHTSPLLLLRPLAEVHPAVTKLVHRRTTPVKILVKCPCHLQVRATRVPDIYYTSLTPSIQEHRLLLLRTSRRLPFSQSPSTTDKQNNKRQAYNNNDDDDNNEET
jgi:hypothetical protein